MSSTSCRVARAIPVEFLPRTRDPMELLSHSFKDPLELHILALSRNGALIWKLARICEMSTSGQGLYLLQNVCLVEELELTRCIEQLEAFIDEITCKPVLVLEATKEKYQRTATILTQDFMPLEAQVVYGNNAREKDGFVYFYTEDEVANLMRESLASNDPCSSEDGDKLSDVFNFLKSHLALLKSAKQEGRVIAYAEMNV